MSLQQAYRKLRATGCACGTREQVLDRLADISIYLGTCDPIQLGAAFLLEQAGCERGHEQLALELEEATA